MRHVIEGYRNVPGEHCGSTAMRNLLAHHCGLELTEAEVFGLGSGLDVLYVRGPDATPALLALGRSVTMEVDVARALQVDYREQVELDDARAWAVVRDEVAAGRPTMLSGDAFHLPYRDFRVHFPAHRFVLVGFDDEAGEALVADRLDAAPQRCPLPALRLSRNPPDFVSTHNLWGRFHDVNVGRPLADAVAHALDRTVRRLRGDDPSQERALALLAGGKAVTATTGLRALAELAADVPALADAPTARYAAACIEKYGTGGGNFRLMFAAFLRRAQALLPGRVPDDAIARAEASAAGWTEAAAALGAFEPARAAAALRGVLADETRLVDALAR